MQVLVKGPPVQVPGQLTDTFEPLVEVGNVAFPQTVGESKVAQLFGGAVHVPLTPLQVPLVQVAVKGPPVQLPGQFTLGVEPFTEVAKEAFPQGVGVSKASQLLGGAVQLPLTPLQVPLVQVAVKGPPVQLPGQLTVAGEPLAVIGKEAFPQGVEELKAAQLLGGAEHVPLTPLHVPLVHVAVKGPPVQVPGQLILTGVALLGEAGNIALPQAVASVLDVQGEIQPLAVQVFPPLQ